MNPNAKKHKSNARVIPVVPIEFHKNDRAANSQSNKFKSTNVSHQVPVVMAIGNNLDHGCSLQSSQMELNISVSTNKVEDLKNDVVLNMS